MQCLLLLWSEQSCILHDLLRIFTRVQGSRSSFTCRHIFDEDRLHAPWTVGVLCTDVSEDRCPVLGIVSILHLSFGFFIYLYMQGLSRAVGAVVIASRTCVPLFHIVHLYHGQSCQSFDLVLTGLLPPLIGAVVIASRTGVPLLNIVHLYPGQFCQSFDVYRQVFYRL